MATVDLTKDTLEEVITGNDMVLLDFWAPWCGPCRQFAPIFESISDTHPDLVFAKINTQEERELAMAFQVRSIPTLMVYREQIIVFSQPGVLAPAGLEALIENIAKLDMDKVHQQVARQDRSQENTE